MDHFDYFLPNSLLTYFSTLYLIFQIFFLFLPSTHNNKHVFHQWTNNDPDPFFLKIKICWIYRTDKVDHRTHFRCFVVSPWVLMGKYSILFVQQGVCIFHFFFFFPDLSLYLHSCHSSNVCRLLLVWENAGDCLLIYSSWHQNNLLMLTYLLKIVFVLSMRGLQHLLSLWGSFCSLNCPIQWSAGEMRASWLWFGSCHQHHLHSRNKNDEKKTNWLVYYPLTLDWIPLCNTFSLNQPF